MKLDQNFGFEYLRMLLDDGNAKTDIVTVGSDILF